VEPEQVVLAEIWMLVVGGLSAMEPAVEVAAVVQAEKKQGVVSQDQSEKILEEELAE
jgi:hypothetical protein